MRRFVLTTLLLSVLGGLAGATPPSWTTWPVTELPGQAPGEAIITLEPVWTLDCGDEAEFLVGKLVSAAAAPGGRVLLVDRQLVQVLVVAADGRVQRTCGRRGEGPGEVTGAWRAVALDDGRIGLVDGMPAPLINPAARPDLAFLDATGDPAGSWPLGGTDHHSPACMVRGLRHTGGRVLAATYRLDIREDRSCVLRQELALHNAPGGDRTVLAQHLVPTSLSAAPTEVESFEPFASGRCDLARDGTVAFAPERDRWLVAVRHADGSGEVYHRPWTQPRRTDHQRQEAADNLGATEGLLDHEPVLGRLRWRPDGRLWIEATAVPPAPGAIVCFDELAPDGTLNRRVHLEAPGASHGDQLLLLEDGRFLLLHAFTPATESTTSPRVTLYRAS